MRKLGQVGKWTRSREIFLNFGITSTVWTEKKHTKTFLLYLPQNSVDSDKILYMLSWINLWYSSLSVFQLIRIVSLHYIVKQRSRFVIGGNWNCEPPNTPNFLSYRLQNQADSDKNVVAIVLSIFATENYNCFHLT